MPILSIMAFPTTQPLLGTTGLSEFEGKPPIEHQIAIKNQFLLHFYNSSM